MLERLPFSASPAFLMSSDLAPVHGERPAGGPGDARSNAWCHERARRGASDSIAARDRSLAAGIRVALPGRTEVVDVDTKVRAMGAVLVFAAGCGGSGVPLRGQADAIAAVRSAESVGAEGTPQASYHLELANEQLAEADELLVQDRREAAEAALVRAKADAELAIALRREAQARDAAQQSREHVQTLREGQQAAAPDAPVTTEGR